MVINERDDERLTSFIDEVMLFLEKKADDAKASNQAGEIGSINDVTLPKITEISIFLDDEYQAFIINILHKFMSKMINETDNFLFGFAERPLYEFITYWLFSAVSDSISENDKSRIKALLFTGYYKHIDRDSSNLDTYLKVKGSNLNKNDLKALSNNTFAQYYERLWSILVNIVKDNSDSNHLSYLNGNPSYKQILSHQHMRIHANPFLVSEVTAEGLDKTIRHRILLAFYLRQLIDYFKLSDPKDCERLKYRFDKFWNNHSIKL